MSHSNRPFDIAELRARLFEYLPRRALSAMTLVSRPFEATAWDHLTSQLTITPHARSSYLRHLAEDSLPNTTYRYCSAYIDLDVAPSEAIAVLLALTTTGIRAVEFAFRSWAKPGWAQHSELLFAALVKRMPSATHFTIDQMPARFQYYLLNPVTERLTSLNLNAPTSDIPPDLDPLHFPVLATLRLSCGYSSSTCPEFMALVAGFIHAPRLESLGFYNCLNYNGPAVCEVARHFSSSVRRLVLVDDSDPQDIHNPLPHLPELRVLEVDVRYADRYLDQPADFLQEKFPELTTLVLQGRPFDVFSGLECLSWDVIKDAIDALRSHVCRLECCYRVERAAYRGSFKTIAIKLLRDASGPDITTEGFLEIVESHREPFPRGVRPFDEFSNRSAHQSSNHGWGDLDDNNGWNVDQ
ncbi:hypothetical protein V5O48_011363 [Marasmius crinis-equi]|uniref:F-box domain-containing protein n=1 Tax=Marasmius crinis-equi TaxID=585013 RepID=A0ABR3F5R9_9AGAR